MKFKRMSEIEQYVHMYMYLGVHVHVDVDVHARMVTVTVDGEIMREKRLPCVQIS